MVYKLQSKLPTWKIKGQKVFLRADLNVPLENGFITDDFRLERARKTLDFLVSNGALIILATHIGRPAGHDMSLSTQHLIPWFKEHGYSISYEPSVESAQQALKTLQQGDIVVLENLRFLPEEKQGSQELAYSLASLADYYVNDAFGSMHSSDTSIACLPMYFEPSDRTIGFLVEEELQAFNKLLSDPQHPYTVIVGGCKVAEKITMLNNMLHTVDTVLICPALAFSLLSSMGIKTGMSYTDSKALKLCRQILHKGEALGKNLVMPLDYVVAKDSLQGKLETVSAHDIPDDRYGISIGEKTVQLYDSIIKTSKTIFFNGLMGFNERQETLHASKLLFEAMVHSGAYTVIGGGDTVAAARKFGYDTSMSFCSTGGGAALAYLSGTSMQGLDKLT